MLGGVIERLDPDATESVVTPGGTRIVRSEEFIQLLTPEGERVDADGFSYDHDDATLAANLRHMVLGRRFDAEATALQRKGQLGLWPPSLGQEAAQVGSGAAVAALDEVFPSYREHAVALMRGIDPLDMLKTMRGTAMVDWDSVDARFHLYSFVIGTQFFSGAQPLAEFERVIEAEAEVPKAIAAAFRDGKLGVMDYYNMQNVISDTQMRGSIASTAKTDDSAPITR